MIWWRFLLYGLRLEARFDGEGRCVVFLVLFRVGLRSVCLVLFVLCALCFAEKGARFGADLGVWVEKRSEGRSLICCFIGVVRSRFILKRGNFSMLMPIIALFG